MGKILVKCEYCGRLVYKWPRDLRRHKHHFCSRECFYAWKREHPTKPRNFKANLLKCDYCGKEFYRPPSNVRGDHVFCSRECAINFRRVTLKCPVCGKAFVRLKSRVKGKVSFCSRECMLKWNRGEKHPNYRRITKICPICGREFEVTPSRDRKFCSHDCMKKWLKETRKGNRNPNYRPKVIAKCLVCGREFETYPSNKDRKFCSWDCWLWWLKNVRKITEDNRKKMLKSLLKRPTKPEMKLIEIIKKNKIPLQYVGDGKLIIGGLNPDFINLENRIIVEVFGKYWHDPKRARPTQREDVRRRIFNKLGYDLVVIWEDELEDEQLVIDKIMSKFGKDS